MVMIHYWLLFLPLAGLLFLFLPCRISVYFRLEGGAARFSISLGPIRILAGERSLPASLEDVARLLGRDLEGDRNLRRPGREKLSLPLLLVRPALRIGWKFIRRTRCIDFRWVTTLGVGEPALTGVLVGWLWVAKGAVGHLVCRNGKGGLCPQISVVPDFSRPAVSSELHCVLIVRWYRILGLLMSLALSWWSAKREAGLGKAAQILAEREPKASGKGL